MLLPYQGKTPTIGRNVFIAPTAVIIGDVTIDDDASIWFNAVLRGDMEPLTVGARTSIQDNCTLHTDHGCPVWVGAGVTVGHNSVIHGCTIEDTVLIGMHSVVLNCARIGTGSIVAAGSVIRQNQLVAPGSLMAGVPAQMKKRLNDEDQAIIQRSVQEYQVLRQAYLLSEHA